MIARRTPRAVSGHVVRVLVVAVFLSILTTVQAVTTAPSATAAPVTDFTPGNLISDAVMYDSSTMNAAAIQTFLNARGSSCTPASGNTCVKDYRENTPSRSADALCTRAYTGASNETAATIIAKVSTACGINPQVLIVTLQKEQGLITATAGKAARTYARALGFGCPDNVGGWCDPQYAGFANQVYSAAKQLKRYAANPNGYSYRAGRTNTILWHPSTSCGTTQVYIENQATASLYNYTPYVPNAAALAAGYGSGDACSSYGNRNFHLYFQSWFGAPVNKAPIGRVDAVTSATASGTIRVQGWALDPDTTASINVHVYLDGKVLKSARADGSRPDVDRAYSLGAAHGFDTSFTATAGKHTVCIYAIDPVQGPHPSIGCSTVEVVGNQTPKGAFDSVTSSGGSLRVRGWALDPDTTASINVHVYVDGKVVRSAIASSPRVDVGRIYGLGDAHGFDVTVPASNGPHSVCVYAINATPGTNPRLGCKDVTVVNLSPKGAFDAAASPAPGTVSVRGWAFDPDVDTPIQVHVAVDGRVVRSVTASASRADVGRVHGVGSNHGFDATVPAVAGRHSVCVFAIDATGGFNPRLGCRDVEVANTPTVGAVEEAVGVPSATGSATVPATRSALRVSGWAWDFDVTEPVGVEMLVDDVVVATGTAQGSRADIPGTSRPEVGFTLSAVAVPGSYTVCVRASDSPAAASIVLGCQDVTVPNTAARGALDTATVTDGIVKVRGWALDVDTSASIPVHVRMDGVLVANGTAALSRPDVDRAFGNGPARGYDLAFAASSGERRVCVYAIGWPVGTGNPTIGCQTITVP